MNAIYNQWITYRISVCVMLLLLWLPPPLASGNINLELRATTPSVIVGSTVNIELYALSDNPAMAQTMSAADVIISWDPTVLQFVGVDNTLAEALLFSDFPASDPYNLNEAVPVQDGDGLYQALAFLGTPIQIIPAGNLLTTIQFVALAATPLTSVNILQSGGSPLGHVKVFDGMIPNLEVTGTIMGSDLAITPSLLLGDMNCDGVLDLFDTAPFVQALTDPAGYMIDFGGICDIGMADFNGDGMSNADDIEGFVNSILNPI